jgi:hypothetical protein
MEGKINIAASINFDHLADTTIYSKEAEPLLTLPQLL